MPPTMSYLPQVVLKFNDSVTLPYEDDNGSDIDRHGAGTWSVLLAKFPGIRIRRLYRRVSAAEVTALVAKAAATDARYRKRNLLTYFVIECPSSVDAAQVAAELNTWPAVEAAYVDRAPRTSTLVCTTDYETPAATGIDAQFAWTVPGGGGQGQTVVDLELGWTLNHDALSTHAIPPPILGVNDPSNSSHGTSALGVICGNGGGFTGIVPNVHTVLVVSAKPDAVSVASLSAVAEAIAFAAVHSPFGGVLVIELETPDFLPVESVPSCFDNIQVATAAGVVVVEAAGNGGSNLDLFVDAAGSTVLDRGPHGSPNPAFKNSSAIVVAAATGVAPHTWRASSNFGTRVDCYACGDSARAPTSNGPGDTASFGCFFDTSAATAIIAGAAVSAQGMWEAHSGQRASPAQMQAMLSDPAHGTAAVGQHAALIGTMPDLQIIAAKIRSPRTVPSAPTNLRVIHT